MTDLVDDLGVDDPDWERIELRVETAPEPQTIECPGCGSEHRVLIESEKIGGLHCPDCDVEIVYDHGGRETPDPPGEQATLIPDGGEPQDAAVPHQHEQALEAARDGLTRTELTNMLHSLDSVHFLHVHDGDEPERTTVDVHFEGEHGRHTRTILRIMRAAGWRPCYVAFSRNRITFEEVDHAE